MCCEITETGKLENDILAHIQLLVIFCSIFVKSRCYYRGRYVHILQNFGLFNLTFQHTPIWRKICCQLLHNFHTFLAFFQTFCVLRFSFLPLNWVFFLSPFVYCPNSYTITLMLQNTGVKLKIFLSFSTETTEFSPSLGVTGTGPRWSRPK